jgi:hypothetical protein
MPISVSARRIEPSDCHTYYRATTELKKRDLYVTTSVFRVLRNAARGFHQELDFAGFRASSEASVAMIHDDNVNQFPLLP